MLTSTLSCFILNSNVQDWYFLQIMDWYSSTFSLILFCISGRDLLPADYGLVPFHLLTHIVLYFRVGSTSCRLWTGTLPPSHSWLSHSLNSWLSHGFMVRPLPLKAHGGTDRKKSHISYSTPLLCLIIFWNFFPHTFTFNTCIQILVLQFQSWIKIACVEVFGAVQMPPRNNIRTSQPKN